MYSFQYWRNIFRRWNYHLINTGNNEIVMQSTQGHSNKQDMLDIIAGIRSAMIAQPRVPVVDITKYRFKK